MAPFLIRSIACIPAPTTFIFGAGDFSPHIVPPHLLHHKRENHNRLKSLNYFRIRLLGLIWQPPQDEKPDLEDYIAADHERFINGAIAIYATLQRPSAERASKVYPDPALLC